MDKKTDYPLYPLTVVTGKTMASIDKESIEDRGVSGLFLMEKAGAGITNDLLKFLPTESLNRCAIFCGKGNNGGDGFVIARHLYQQGYLPYIALLANPEKLQGDAKTNYLRLKELGLNITICQKEEEIDSFIEYLPSGAIYIDALLGTGITGASRGLIAYTIDKINTRTDKSLVISVDISSGAEADTGKVEGSAIYADYVYTMGLPKVGHLLYPGSDYYKKLKILDIGFPRDLLENADKKAELLKDSLIDQWLPTRKQSSHKGSEGHLLIIAGSRGMTGAALLSAKAALQMGAGLITCACPQSLLPIYATSVLEMLTIPVDETPNGSFSEESFLDLFKDEKKYSAVLIGPGLGRNASTQNLVKKVANEINIPILFDGDGLYPLTIESLSKCKAPWVATPHPGEMSRFFDTTSSDIQKNRWKYAQQFSEHAGGVLCLKGPKTVISRQEEKPYINPTGNPGMASGGMGDVLAGMIAALMARGVSPYHAACSGAFLHGRAADLLQEEQQKETLCASEIIDYIAKAVTSVRDVKKIAYK